ncbi:hypothetical protein BLNAU_12682 [Blattamonas nauphoetae]|uniref:Uncharacterized protein n=1 Tax=Blattamonas nauphoetae TaxID=2049346 RepID=A0ABQ9XQL5_9EUKA|nr:hypothetical protein BLNAU_12682 [Blattamonas nauphoetae]
MIPNLQRLTFNYCDIDSWDLVKQLIEECKPSIPSLVHLRLKNTPVLLVKTPLSFGIAPTRINTQGLGADAYWGPPPETMEQVKEKENRVMILFYLGNLNTLNGSAITQKEKRMVKRMKEDLLEEQKEREEQKLQNVEEDPQPAPVSLPTTTTLPSATGMISEPPRPAKSKKDAKATFLKNMQRNRTQKT